MRCAIWPTLLFVSVLAFATDAEKISKFEPIDVFQLEFANSPRVSPDGKHVVYVRSFMDIMKDRVRGNLWLAAVDGSSNRPLTSGNENHGSPRWSPDGDRLAFVKDGEIHIRWMDSGQTAQISNLPNSPNGLSWSPDGKWFAFSMFVPDKPKSFAKMPPKPPGAEWAKPAIVIDSLIYRADGAGYLPEGFSQIFLMRSDGGTPRQLTKGSFDHGAPQWMPDGKTLVFSANHHEDGPYEPNNSEVHLLDIASGKITTLTNRLGPDGSPRVSPDGRHIGYVGYDDRYQGYQVNNIYIMDADGKNSRLLTGDLDRRLSNLQWSQDGKHLYFQYSDQGNGKIARVSLKGKVETLTGFVGGTTMGRPYASGTYHTANGVVAFTYGPASQPADLAVLDGGGKAKLLTDLHSDLFGHKPLGEVEEIRYPSSHDGREIQGWIIKPPGFDPSKKYPLILEIHGGPFADYGDRFSAECQLFASAGYVVLYTNPRGSSSYGEEFGNLIHHNYPGEDYDDLISGVDAVIAKGYVDPDNLFVTGGSGGGVLTAWIVGKTDKFRAAVVAKPVINWTSFALTADGYTFFYKYWFPGFPWDHQEQYWRRSPLSLVGNVNTPTMLLTGEADYRTPISETEQYYQALRLRKVDTMMVRIPNASHGIAARPSNLIAKVNNILAWFERYRTNKDD